ncbi:trypsin-like peptidase domain-containing protein [Candidatus Mcinerneyibacteriota bacterium]|nr:trypsin-like peptidase domain-containing protein [Candidatus Mcinerneyibacteriota bacterium]
MILSRDKSGRIPLRTLLIIGGAILLLTLGFGGGRLLSGLKEGQRVKQPFNLSQGVSRDVSAERAGALAVAAQNVLPAVVSIETEYEPMQRRSNDVFEEFFREFFGSAPDSRRDTKHGVGSGVIISPEGLILTADHVVEGASSIFATLPDGRQYKLKLLGEDSMNDVALLRAEGTELPHVILGDSDILVQGEWVIAAGNPFGLMAGDPQPTITAGIVSALMRTIQIDDGQGKKHYYGLIQTDASINPGNSGGPLVNARGELVGINNAIFSTSGGSQGIGFAIPVNTCRKSIEAILKNGSVQRGWMGVGVVDIDEELKKKFEMGVFHGVVVAKVYPGSAAAKAGLVPGQIVTSLNGIPVRNSRWWNGLAMRINAGDQVLLGLWDAGKEMEISFAPQSFQLNSALASLGVESLKPLDYETAVRYNIRPEKGLLIESLREKAPLYKAGLRPNDVLRVFGGRKIYEKADLEAVLSRLLPGDEIEIIAERRGYFFKTQARW